ncbi:SIL1 [Candida theae]|uniref:Nucleotide exchange factor SIL1 n=1 Tax=Candida theae TaxID=1198502 RepID=A0AAD5FXC8_9ASCO|nr:SIL1 [Candida theae]KAI5952131.1 SIL1 [Candida theae]
MLLSDIKVLLSVALFSTQLTTAATVVDVEEELICPDPTNPTICYPKIFVATNDWQIIKPGQDIPAGLHVRLNLETSEREAKLMSGESDNEVKEESVVVVVGGDNGGEQAHNDDSDKLKHEQIASALHINKKNKSRVSQGDLSDFDSAVEEVEHYDQHGDKERLLKALDTINDLSHDIELGEQLTSNGNLFHKLIDLSSNTNDVQLEEKIYNIIAASLRNNPGAVANLLDGKVAGLNVEEFIDSLLKAINESPSIIQKRKTGIIQALVQNPSIAEELFSFEHPKGLNQVIGVYPSLSAEAKVRVVHILEDLNLRGNNNDKRTIEDTDPDSNMSKFIQQALSEGKFKNDDDAKAFFTNLANLHKNDRRLKPSSEFLQWLSKEVELGKERKKREDVSQQDLDFDKFMLSARHEIFGNPMAMRKATADEL